MSVSLDINARHLLCVVVGATALALACGRGAAKSEPDEAEKQPDEASHARGPHGGRLLGERPFQVEVTIYERGIPPQFRVFAYEQGKPVAPTELRLEIDLHRFGGRVDRIRFRPEQDYLVGDQVVEEPHSFDADVRAERGGARNAWQYSQREGRVELNDDAVRTSGISIETAGPVRMQSVLELPGEIAFNADKLAHVVPRMAGVLAEIRKNQGDDVKRGETIAVLDSRELAEAKRAYLESAHEVSFAKRAFEREQGLWKKNISSEADYLAAERAYSEATLKQQSARQQLLALGIGSAALEALAKPDSTLTRYELRAPFDGAIIEKRVATGQAVTADDDLFTIADLSSVWVDINVYAKDIEQVKVGQDVTVRSTSSTATASGKISFIGALVGEQTRSARARVVLPDPERRWKPGLFVSVAIVQEELTVPVAVKREALQKFRDWDVVFARAGNEFEARPLELGRQNEAWVEVTRGLLAGERYAAANSFILKADVGKAGASHDH